MKHWLIGSVAAAALLAACGGKDKAEGAGAAVQVGDVKVAGLELRPGDAAEAGDALAALSLSESGSGRVSFADTSASGAEAVFNDVTIAVDGGDSPIKAGSLAFKGLEMTDSGANFSQMTLSDLSVAPDGDVFNISSVQLTNPSPELGAWVSSLMGQGEPAAFPAMDKLSFDGLNLNGLAVAAEDIDNLDVFELGAIDVRNLSATGVGSMVIEGLNVVGTEDGEAINISLGSMGVAGVNEVVMTALTSGFASGSSGADSDALLSEVMSLVSANPGDPGYDSFTLDAFSADFLGLAIDLPSMDAAVTRDKQGRATRSVTNPFKLSVKANPEGELGSQLAGPLSLMGYEVLNFSGQSDVKMDPDADTFTSEGKNNYLALEDGFKLSYGGSFAGLGEFYKAMADSAESGANDNEAMLGALSSLTLNTMDISFEDNSIVDKAFALSGAMSGQDPEGMRAQAVAGVAFLPIMAGQAGVDPELAAEVGGALSKFLNDSGTLTIKLDPKTPLTAADFEDPTTLTKSRLGFSAQTK